MKTIKWLVSEVQLSKQKPTLDSRGLHQYEQWGSTSGPENANADQERHCLVSGSSRHKTLLLLETDVLANQMRANEHDPELHPSTGHNKGK